MEQQDHDLLIRLETKMDLAMGEIREIKEGTAARLLVLENDHVSTRSFGDHEKRLRRLETWGLISIGFLYAISVGWVVYVYLHPK